MAVDFSGAWGGRVSFAPWLTVWRRPRLRRRADRGEESEVGDQLVRRPAPSPPRLAHRPRVLFGYDKQTPKIKVLGKGSGAHA